MSSFDKQMKARQILADRVAGFLQDGYHILFDYKDSSLVFVKLTHNNGNRITLKLHLDDGTLSQSTNHVQNYCETLY